MPQIAWFDKVIADCLTKNSYREEKWLALLSSQDSKIDWRAVRTKSTICISVAIVSTSAKVTPPIRSLALKLVC